MANLWSSLACVFQTMVGVSCSEPAEPLILDSSNIEQVQISWIPSGYEALLGHPSAKEINDFFLQLPDAKASYKNPKDFYNATAMLFNCYAYASGSTGNPFVFRKQDNQYISTMAMPGALSGQPMRMMTAEELDRAVVADGYQKLEIKKPGLTTKNITKDGYTLIAAFIDPKLTDDDGVSFHFAKRNKDGSWSHKNGWGDVMESRYLSSETLREPHLHPEDYLGNRYEFVGYYWRPDAGINVIGGDMAGSVFNKDGKIIEDGLFNSNTMRNDIWVGLRSDYLATSFEVSGAHLTQSENGYILELSKESGEVVSVTLPAEMVFDEYAGDSFEKTGNKLVDLDDPSGPDIHVIITPNGDSFIQEKPPSVEGVRKDTPFPKEVQALNSMPSFITLNNI